MKPWVYKDVGRDGLWHIHCPECLMARQGICHGKYSDREAALTNAAAHVRNEHRPVAKEEW